MNDNGNGNGGNRRDTMLRTVKILLEKALMSQGSTDTFLLNEAKAWQEKAESIMAKYNISRAETIVLEREAGKVNMVREDIDCFYEDNVQDWEGRLGWAITKAFDTEAIRIPDYNGGITKLAFLGRPEDVANTVYFFDYLQAAIAANARKVFVSKRDKQDFGVGAVAVLKDRLIDLNRQDILPENCRAIIVLNKGDVNTFVKKEFPYLKHNVGKSVRCNGAYEKGREFGNKVALNRAVNGEAHTQIG